MNRHYKKVVQHTVKYLRTWWVLKRVLVLVLIPCPLAPCIATDEGRGSTLQLCNSPPSRSRKEQTVLYDQPPSHPIIKYIPSTLPPIHFLHSLLVY